MKWGHGARTWGDVLELRGPHLTASKEMGTLVLQPLEENSFDTTSEFSDTPVTEPPVWGAASQPPETVREDRPSVPPLDLWRQ